MKFLCDRCQTRYSIGDDRVRGKILKIRCKNCGNVITVREGMSPPEGEAEPPNRAKKSTTAAPEFLDERSAAERATTREPAAAAAAGSAAAAKPVTAAKRAVAAEARTAGAGTARAAQVDAARGAQVDAARGAQVDAARGAQADAARGASAAGARGAAAGAGRGAQAEPVRSSGAGGGRSTGPETARGFGGASDSLNAAFASAMARPKTPPPAPAALEEEWYVSVDGDQAGPYSLADAQRWVGQQPHDAELHCWSEGFDDWLPIDKVSHFRGLRKRPPPAAAPPPLPRAPGAQRPLVGSPSPEDTPKPLFAATMASLERGAAAAGATSASSASSASSGFGLPTPLEPRPEAKLDAKPEAKLDAKPAGKAAAKLDARPAAKPDARPASRFEARPLLGNAFDSSESGDAATQLEAMPFEDPPISVPAPVSSPVPTPISVAPAVAGLASADAAVAAAEASAPIRADFGADDLDFGEVSRVVNLADLARGGGGDRGPGRHASTATPAFGRAITANPALRGTGASPAFRGTGAVVNLGAGGPAEGDAALSMGPVIRAHRRGLIALLVVAGVLVVGVIGAVIVFVVNDDDAPGNNLAAVHDIDTSRPEDPITHRPTGSASATTPVAPAPVAPRPTQHIRPGPSNGSQAAEAAPAAGSLASDEIEDAARKHQEMTQRCYMRSQRGADAILIGDVKKIAVTLTIDRDGNVSDLQLSDHAGDNLGKCLSGAIKSWKFRQSPGGTYRFSLNFVSG